ncbi:hypothetical protein EMIT036CA2_50350 [Chryseobacterium sp. IT-36CA2]
MPPCHGGGRGFESRPDRKKSSRNRRLFLFIDFDKVWMLNHKDGAYIF